MQGPERRIVRSRVVGSGGDRHAVQQRIEKRLGVQSGISTLSFRSNWKRKCAFPRTSQSSSRSLAVISTGRACQATIERSWSFIYNSLATTKQSNTQAINNWSSKTGCVDWKEKLRIPSLLPAAIRHELISGWYQFPGGNASLLEKTSLVLDEIGAPSHEGLVLADP
jgi:hypothetical protein